MPWEPRKGESWEDFRERERARWRAIGRTPEYRTRRRKWWRARHERLTGGRDLRTTHTDETRARIIEAVLAGKGVVEIIRMPGMPRCETFYRWLKVDEDFRRRYEQARFIVAVEPVLAALDELKRSGR